MSPPTLQDQITAIKVTENEYISRCLPQKMGNFLPIAYGGCTTSVAVHAACQTVDKDFHIFSVLGSFHGPTKIDRMVKCHVFRTRQTRTFATRRVVAYQTQDDGSDRSCAEIFIDFHICENGMFEYSAPPSQELRVSPKDQLKTAERSDLVRGALKKGQITQTAADIQLKDWNTIDELFEIRHCLDGVTGQNVYGLAPNVVTTQDHLPIYDKRSGEWFRAREPLDSEAEHIAALAFAMDGGISFVPLQHDHRDLRDVGSWSTLDFALRVFLPEVKIDSWLQRERRTIAAHGAKTYSELRVWNESGSMVVVMTQVSITRPSKRVSKGKTKL